MLRLIRDFARTCRSDSLLCVGPDGAKIVGEAVAPVLRASGASRSSSGRESCDSGALGSQKSAFRARTRKRVLKGSKEVH
jgi:hypothetical protein